MNEEDFEEELEDDNLEEEMDKVKEAKKVKSTKVEQSEEEVAEETYEIFVQPERIGIKDSRTGEPITEGFKDGDEGILMALKMIMNKLDKISIASGAQ